MQASSKKALAERRTLVEDWQRDLTKHGLHEGYGPAQRLFDACIMLYKQCLRPLASKPSLTRPLRRKLDRAHQTLRLWGQETGASAGHLDRLLGKSDYIQSLVLLSLVDVGKLLSQRLARHAFDDEDEQGAAIQESNVLVSIRESELILHDVAAQEKPSTEEETAIGSYDPEHEFGTLQDLIEELLSDCEALVELQAVLQDSTLELLDLDVPQPSFENQTATSTCIDTSPARYYIERVMARFPKAPSSVLQLLGSNNLARFMRCQRTRELNIEAAKTSTFSSNKSAMASTFHDSGLGSSIPEDSLYTETVMSFVAPDGSHSRFPPLPQAAAGGGSFECACCSCRIQIRSKAAWKKHLLKQLRPYSCIFEECTHCQTTFESKLSWTEHLEIDHAFDPGWKSFPCPLCQLETGSGRQNVSNHIARHLEEIALAALPISMYSEDEIAPESDASDPSVNDLFPDLPVIDPILKQPRSKGMDIREMPNNELQNRKNQSMHTAQPINYDPLSGEPCDSYRCSCGEVFDRDQIHTHLQSHGTLLICNYCDCDDKFETQEDLRNHMALHVKSFNCSHCSCKTVTGFDTLDELREHESKCHQFERYEQSALSKYNDLYYRNQLWSIARASNNQLQGDRASPLSYIPYPDIKDSTSHHMQRPDLPRLKNSVVSAPTNSPTEAKGTESSKSEPKPQQRIKSRSPSPSILDWWPPRNLTMEEIRQAKNTFDVRPVRQHFRRRSSKQNSIQ